MESLNIFMHVQVDERRTLDAHSLPPDSPPSTTLTIPTRFNSVQNNYTVYSVNLFVAKQSIWWGNCCLLSVHVLTSARYHPDKKLGEKSIPVLFIERP